MAYLRPTGKYPEFRDDGPQRPSIQFFGEKIRENIEKCPVAQYIITDRGNSDFVVRGNKTKLGLHIETCEVCQGVSTSAPISDPVDESVMYAISKPVAKKLATRYRDMDSRNISRLIDALLDDIEMYTKNVSELTKKLGELEQKYEDLKTIRNASLRPALFPIQKLVTRDSMLSKTLAYEKELRKKAEDELRLLKLEKGEK